ncbi:major facilitator superfamily protein [Klebsiella aerogenes]|nr:major facilitator superfamily protein [Klebsiella aerogenes]
MSNTTTADTAPASDVRDKVASSQINLLNVAPGVYPRHPGAIFRRTGHLRPALLRAAILPVLSGEFGVSPASSSISLSISTAMLAIGLLFTGPLSDAIGRKPVMVTALLLAACCSLLSTMMTSWHGILIMRALIGLSLSA